ncbi:hypothetical protein PanWU01x14_173000 [Parasponia andersonii]|uniref:Uncharacterized protein n=1 Tax=Parasponia andersonii TaxID=3476 RepID=A0A2P5C933_PARAD|nr:hypothetical protein PanWU01x14_173000 [Parasponia andersonii]
MQLSNCREGFWSIIKLPWLKTHKSLKVISLIQLTFPRSWRLIVWIAHLDKCLLHCLDQMSEIRMKRFGIRLVPRNSSRRHP